MASAISSYLRLAELFPFGLHNAWRGNQGEVPFEEGFSDGFAEVRVLAKFWLVLFVCLFVVFLPPCSI